MTRLDANENGDKCAWVGENLAHRTGRRSRSRARSATSRATQGGTFAVQSLWSNDSAEGAGYCAGAGTDLPTG